MLIESGSSIQTFLTCPRLYEYKYVKLLELPGYSSALGFGTFVHAEIERDRGAIIDSVDRELNRFIESKPIEFHEQINVDKNTASLVFQLWKNFWDSAPVYGNKEYQWVNTEKEWGFNIGDLGRHVGKSDGVVRDKNGNHFVYELKTAADRDRDGYVHRLEIDRQVSSNIMALQREGVSVAGALYDIIWKPTIRKLTGRKTKPDETAGELAERMVGIMANHNPDNGPPFFERQIIYRSERVMNEHEKDLRIQLEMIRKANENGFCRNTGSCHNYNMLCPFFTACVGGRTELEELYARKDRKLPELSKEIQNANS